MQPQQEMLQNTQPLQGMLVARKRCTVRYILMPTI